MALKIACSNPRYFFLDFDRKDCFCSLMTAQITRKKINLPKFFLLIMLGRAQQQIAILNLLKIKSSKDIFDSSKCKVTFGLKYNILRKTIEGYLDSTSVHFQKR